jgi:hypothetical protein
MTPQEQQMIQGLITRIQNTPLTDKDPEAEQFLAQSLGRNPDALYILAQTVLVQTYGLEQAQKQLADARAQLQQMREQQAAPAAPQKHTSFLGSIFGTEPDARPAPPPPTQAPYAPVPSYPQPAPYAPAQYAPAQPGFGGGGFLRGAMQTAAGVAAGAVAFEGIESLMHGFGGHGGGFGGGSGFGGFGTDAPREEIINNYYGDSGDRERGHDDDGRGFLGADDAASTDADDVGVDDTFDTSNDDTGDDSSTGDDGSFS